MLGRVTDLGRSGEITPAELALATRNRGMPLEGMRHDVTPVGLHYLLVHFDIPALDPERWRLQITGDHMRRTTGGLWPRRTVEAALSAWRVRVRFFAVDDQSRGTFKRLDLQTGDFQEVLLPGDVRQRDTVWAALDARRAAFGGFEVSLDRG